MFYQIFFFYIYENILTWKGSPTSTAVARRKTSDIELMIIFCLTHAHFVGLALDDIPIITNGKYLKHQTMLRLSFNIPYVGFPMTYMLAREITCVHYHCSYKPECQ